MDFNSKNFEVIFDRTNKKISLTELEGRLLKFLSENIDGSTKKELLSKVIADKVKEIRLSSS